ncbi:uncharacterized protein LOC118435598 [Folsomia candida]|uniref:uncharacterized protein LOC118435598 n=1 Tax=Folsomia candida TaxID=158441 RepID=UPI00160558DF|nr:uncharacterized protein LOC118435598 [Folsomia candida]
MEASREERSVQEIALNNPIILKEIFKCASTPLKSCRLVCQFWNNIVLSLPNTRLASKLAHNDKDDSDDDSQAVQYFSLCRALDGRLAKRISANSDIVSFGWKLMYICDKFNDRVQILELCLRKENSLKLVCPVLRNCCPNLKQLRIVGKFIAKDLDLFPPGEEQILPVKPNLTLFALTCWNFRPEIKFSTTLANLIDLVVNASPNLSEVTIPWGFYPDLSNSKSLVSLNIALDEVDPIKIEDIQNVSKLSGMLHQVNGQLVNLTIGTVQGAFLLLPSTHYRFENRPQIGFHLTRRMPKLRKFSNRIVEMFRCADFFQNIEMMPFLETLVIGRQLEKRGVDEILQGICKAKMVLPSVRNLEVVELFNSRLLDRVATAFPNVERFEMVRMLAREVEGEVRRLEVAVVLEAFRGWKRLKHLKLTLSEFPVQMGEFIWGLLRGEELFRRLSTLEIKMRRWDENYETRDFSEDEMSLFKQALLVMDKMDRVTIAGLDLSTESRNNIMDFVASHKISASKFRMMGGEFL